MGQSDTKEKILDTAEKLFAKKGFHSTSLRLITKEAGVNLAAVNYHFGSKESLLEAVFERRLNPLNSIRRKRLKEIRDNAGKTGTLPSVEDVLRAVIEPTLKFKASGKGAENFIALVGRSMVEPNETVLRIFQNRIRPLFLLCFEILCEALPNMPKETIFLKTHFSVGAMSHIMCERGKMEVLPDGINPVQDMDNVIDLLVRFVTAGMESK